MANKIVFSSNINIGQNGAENDDEFLFKCFVDHPALTELRTVPSPAMFALGSTGIGKTAILRMIEKLESNCKSLELQEMSMGHIANSDVIQFLQSIQVDLNLFFQALWRHVIIIEYIKLIGAVDSQDRLKGFVRKLAEIFVGNARLLEKMEAFVKENENRFWNTIDQNIIELTQGLESSVQADLGGEVEKFNAHAGYARHLKSEKKQQLQQRARKFVDSGTIAELSQVVSCLAEYTARRPEKYFILIDGVDEHWVEEGIKFQLIRALIETVRSLQKLRNFKPVIALRNDIYQRMIIESPSSVAQLEKYDDHMVKIKWTKDQLWQLAERRINHLFKWKYSSENVHFVDVFKQQVDTRITVWNYIVDRTLLRPRDVINFINFAFQAAEGKSAVSKSDLLKAEHDYSDLRLRTLKFEWQGTFPAIDVMLDLLQNRAPSFLVANVCTSDFVNMLFDRVGSSGNGHRDPLWLWMSRTLDSGSILEPIDLAQEVFHRLHLVGSVGLKLSSNSAWHWIHETGKSVAKHSITTETRVDIHPMLHFSLNNVARARQ